MDRNGALVLSAVTESELWASNIWEGRPWLGANPIALGGMGAVGGVSAGHADDAGAPVRSVLRRRRAFRLRLHRIAGRGTGCCRFNKNYQGKER